MTTIQTVTRATLVAIISNLADTFFTGGTDRTDRVEQSTVLDTLEPCVGPDDRQGCSHGESY